MNRLLWWAGLMAALIAALASPSARAGFSFQINAITPGGGAEDGFKIAELPNGTFTVVKPGDNPVTHAGEGAQNATVSYTANGNVIQGTATIDGVSFTFRATSNQDSATSTSPAVVTTNITASNTGGSTQSFGFFASDSPFAAPSSTRLLQAKIHSFSDDTAGTSVFSNANIGGTSHTAQTSAVTGPGQNQVSNQVSVNTGSPYALSDVGGITGLVPGSTAHFLSTASFAMPEPTGVLLGLVGLPCMAGLVGWVRRRRAAAAA
jgi:hypothetical protein